MLRINKKLTWFDLDRIAKIAAQAPIPKTTNKKKLPKKDIKDFKEILKDHERDVEHIPFSQLEIILNFLVKNRENSYFKYIIEEWFTPELINYLNSLYELPQTSELFDNAHSIETIKKSFPKIDFLFNQLEQPESKEESLINTYLEYALTKIYINAFIHLFQDEKNEKQDDLENKQIQDKLGQKQKRNIIEGLKKLSLTQIEQLGKTIKNLTELFDSAKITDALEDFFALRTPSCDQALQQLKIVYTLFHAQKTNKIAMELAQRLAQIILRNPKQAEALLKKIPSPWTEAFLTRTSTLLDDWEQKNVKLYTHVISQGYRGKYPGNFFYQSCKRPLLEYDLALMPMEEKPTLQNLRINNQNLPILIEHNKDEHNKDYYIYGMDGITEILNKLDSIESLKNLNFYEESKKIRVSKIQNSEIYNAIKSKKGHIPSIDIQLPVELIEGIVNEIPYSISGQIKKEEIDELLIKDSNKTDRKTRLIM